jgi:hypothetical protein
MHSRASGRRRRGTRSSELWRGGRGSADKESEIGHDESTLYAAEVPGFMILDFMSQDRIVLRVVETETGDVYVRALR